MLNPIIQFLNGNNAPKEILNRMQAIKQFMQGKDTNMIYRQMLDTNPQFRKFVQDSEGKLIEDIAMEYDIDLNLLKKFL